VTDGVEGHWWAEGKLVCDRERKLNSTGVDPYLIESMTDEEVVMRHRGGPVRYDLRRGV
jgi:hypothetical protein